MLEETKLSRVRMAASGVGSGGAGGGQQLLAGWSHRFILDASSGSSAKTHPRHSVREHDESRETGGFSQEHWDGANQQSQKVKDQMFTRDILPLKQALRTI